MKKNIVFIPFIKREENFTKAGVGKKGRTTGYEYGISSWRKWCEKNGHELVILDTLLVPESEMLITWQRWKVLDILEHNEIEYDQVLVVDADTIVHPDCPNFFEETDRKFCSVPSEGCYEWAGRAINGYSKMFFDCEDYIKIYEFFMTGFVIVNKDHKEFFDKVFAWYDENQQEILDSYDKLQTGSDITLVNLLRKKFDVDIKYLPKQYSVEALSRKNLLYMEPQHYWGDTLKNLYNSGYVYQFNAIPANSLGRHREYWMKRIHTELWGDL